MLLLKILGLMTLLPLAGALSNAGKTFFQTFNFNHPVVQQNVIHTFILSTDADSCIVTVTIDTPPLTSYTVSILKSQAVVYTVNAAPTRGIKLEAPCDFIAYGLNFAPYSADGWLAIPVESLGTEYAILGVEPFFADEPTQLTIVATTDRTTCTTTFADGTSRVSTLNAFGVDYYTDSKDLTGARVKCNNKVSVLTGQRCSFIPADCGYCDHTVEQVPPLTTLGRNFAMVPMNPTCTSPPTCCSDPKFCSICSEIYRILAIENDTLVARNGTETSESFTLQAGQSRYILLSQTEYSHLVSTKPVLLAQYINGQEYEGSLQDPAFTIIPQIESFASKYQAATCFPQFDTHYVNLVVKAGTSSQLLLNGAPFLASNTPKAIPSTDFEAFRYRFDCSEANGNPISLLIQHNQNLNFGLFAYGFKKYISYAYPGGMNLNDDVYFKCAESQIKAPLVIKFQACDLTTFIPTFDTPETWTDEQCCQAKATLTQQDQLVNATSCTKTIQRTWTLTDGCARSIQATQIAVIQQQLDTYLPPPDYYYKGKCDCSKPFQGFDFGQPTLAQNCKTTTAIKMSTLTDDKKYLNRTWVISQNCASQAQIFNQNITCVTRTRSNRSDNRCKCECGSPACKRSGGFDKRSDEKTTCVKEDQNPKGKGNQGKGNQGKGNQQNKSD